MGQHAIAMMTVVVLGLLSCRSTPREVGSPPLRMKSFLGDSSSVYPAGLLIRFGWTPTQVRQAVPDARCQDNACQWTVSDAVGKISAQAQLDASNRVEILELEIP